jgi:hypothetical protein
MIQEGLPKSEHYLDLKRKEKLGNLGYHIRKKYCDLYRSLSNILTEKYNRHVMRMGDTCNEHIILIREHF